LRDRIKAIGGLVWILLGLDEEEKEEWRTRSGVGG
jgi:hypothetical protein